MADYMATRNVGEVERKRACAVLTAVALVTMLATSAAAQTYPTRPIRLIVPFAAGGGNDIVARLIQPDLEKALGQRLVIENKPAASGIVGTDQVAKAAPDGYSLLMAFTTHTVNPAVTAKLPYDTERDLAPIVLVGKSPLLFSVNHLDARLASPGQCRDLAGARDRQCRTRPASAGPSDHCRKRLSRL
jgi:tripartite-type tricarboxylate transporter receptor subunit TctC